MTINIINFVYCGQSFYKDVGLYEPTREELIRAVQLCKRADDIFDFEDVDHWDLAAIIYPHWQLVEDWLSYNRDDVYLYLANDEPEGGINPWLFYLGPDKHYGTVLGAIHAKMAEKGSLPEELE